MIRNDIIDLITQKTGLPPGQALEIFGRVIETIKETLIAGEEVKISGLGTFTVRFKKARIGRNPKTKEEHVISARKIVSFKASDMTKEAISSGKPQNNMAEDTILHKRTFS